MSARSKATFERGPSAGPLPSRPAPPRGAPAVRGGRGHTLTLSLQQPDGRHRGVLTRSRVERWIRAALRKTAEITVRVVDEAEGRALNRDYREKDHATNVLTFNYRRSPLVIADIVLCAPVVDREAQEQGKPLDAHYAHLIVHGTLHAQGFDHERAADAEKMEAREVELLAALGYPNPYRPWVPR